MPSRDLSSGREGINSSAGNVANVISVTPNNDKYSAAMLAMRPAFVPLIVGYPKIDAAGGC